MLALAHSFEFDFFKSCFVDKGAFDFAMIDDCRTLAVQFQHVAVLNQNEILFRVAEMVLDEFFVTKQHAIFAVNWHHEPGPHGLSHDADVLL